MEIRQLRYFVAVAELGSFTRAANALGIAQPALSRQVKNLEFETKATLLTRHQQGVSPTEAGRLLLSHAHSILSQLERCKAELDPQGSELPIKLSVGMPIAVMSILGAYIFERLTALYPMVELKLVEGYSAFLHEWLYSGSLDFAFLYAVPDAGVRHVPVFTEQLHVVAPNNEEMQTRPAFTREELGKLHLILPHRPHPTWDLLDTAGIEVSHHIPASALRTMLDLVQHGRGHAIMSRASARSALEAGSLVAIPLRPPITRTVSLCVTSFRTNSAAASPIFDALIQEVRSFAETNDLARSLCWETVG